MELLPLSGKAQASYHLADSRINIFEGSVSSGKTITSILRWIKFIVSAPPGALLMSGKTERTLKRNVVDPMVDLLGPKRVKFRIGAGELEILDRKIYICGANDEQAQEKIRGLSLRGAYCDEISTYPESFYTMLMSRLRLENSKLFGTTNPDSMMHWLHDNWLEKASIHVTGEGEIRATNGQLDLARFSFRLEDNPYLPRDYVESIKKEYTGLWYKRFIEGKWVLAEGAIYDMFDPSIHVVKEVPDNLDFISVGVDYGTVNPFDAVAIGIGDGVLYVTNEYRFDAKKERKQNTDSEYLQAIIKWLDDDELKKKFGQFSSPRFVCIDPSARSFIVECLFSNIFTPTKANNAVLDGIRCVSSLLANRQLFIHESCDALIKELSTYAWDTQAALKGLDVPLKINDHSCDALRYGIYTTRNMWRSQVHDFTKYQNAIAA